MALARHVPTTGIHNFRDFGGYYAAGGNRLRSGRLFRSGDHSRASDHDLAMIQAMAFDTIVDLRGSSERMKAPCKRPLPFDVPVIFSDGETATVAPHVEAAAHAQSASDIRREMISRYQELPFRPYLVDVYRRYVEALSRIEGASVVYCSAGKDRTGVIVAIVQSILGVNRDDVLEDYLLTNDAPGQAERVAVLQGDLEQRFGPGLSEDAIRVVTGVQPEFLEAALSAIVSRHGSIEAYAAEMLGVSKQIRTSLLQNYLI